MRYENFAKAKELVEQIDGMQKRLDEISSDKVIVSIKPYDRHNETIVLGVDDETAYGDYARTFVAAIKTDIKSTIDKLKAELEAL